MFSSSDQQLLALAGVLVKAFKLLMLHENYQGLASLIWVEIAKIDLNFCDL